MNELERLVANKLMGFGILADIRNLQRVKELIELIKNEETEQLILSGVGQQREQLIKYEKFVNKENYQIMSYSINKNIDNFLLIN